MPTILMPCLRCGYQHEAYQPCLSSSVYPLDNHIEWQQPQARVTPTIDDIYLEMRNNTRDQEAAFAVITKRLDEIASQQNDLIEWIYQNFGVYLKRP